MKKAAGNLQEKISCEDEKCALVSIFEFDTYFFKFCQIVTIKLQTKSFVTWQQCK
jgi:hypothetical protein